MFFCSPRAKRGAELERCACWRGQGTVCFQNAVFSGLRHLKDMYCADSGVHLTPLHAPTLSSVLTVWPGQNFPLSTLCHPICSLPGPSAAPPWACAHADRSWGSITQFPACPPQGEERRNCAQSDCTEDSVNSQPHRPSHSSPVPGTLQLALCSLLPSLWHLLIVSVPLVHSGENVICSSLFSSSDGLGMPGLLQSSYPATPMKDDAFLLPLVHAILNNKILFIPAWFLCAVLSWLISRPVFVICEIDCTKTVGVNLIKIHL